MSVIRHDDAIFCQVCELWLNGQRQYDDHLITKRHKRRSMRMRVATEALRKMGLCLARKACVENEYRAAQVHIRTALVLAHKFLLEREATDEGTILSFRCTLL